VCKSQIGDVFEITKSKIKKKKDIDQEYPEQLCIGSPVGYASHSSKNRTSFRMSHLKLVSFASSASVSSGSTAFALGNSVL